MSSRERRRQKRILMKGTKAVSYSYSLWIDLHDLDRKKFKIDQYVITIGRHGAIQLRRDMNETLSVDHDHISKGEILKSHNRIESNKALCEIKKWEQRLLESPLGKTEQDIVAFYDDVLKLFDDWSLSHPDISHKDSK